MKITALIPALLLALVGCRAPSDLSGYWVLERSQYQLDGEPFSFTYPLVSEEDGCTRESGGYFDISGNLGTYVFWIEDTCSSDGMGEEADIIVAHDWQESYTVSVQDGGELFDCSLISRGDTEMFCLHTDAGGNVVTTDWAKE